MMITPRRSTLAFLAAMTMAGAASAGPPSATVTDRCVSDNEDGQDLERAGRLRDAAERFRACAITTCPKLVHYDCVERLEAIQRVTPTVVFLVNDEGGRAIPNVVITIDGGPLGDRREGDAIRTDPGEHVFQFAADGFISVTKHVALAAGAPRREETVVLMRVAPTERQVTPTASLDTRSTQRWISYLLAGAGAVGLGIGGGAAWAAADAHSDANATCGSPCDRRAAFEAESRAETWANVSTVSVIAGATLAVGGFILLATAPKRPTMAASSLR